MAYATICTPCLDEKHDDCLSAGWDLPADLPEEFCGGAFCVCSHDEPSKFEQSVRRGLKERNV